MTAVRRGAWVTLRYVTSLFFLGVILQFFLVGYGLFDMKHGATIDNAKSLDAHRSVGFLLSDIGGVLMLILVLLAWPTPRKLLSALDRSRGARVRAGDPRRSRVQPLGRRDAASRERPHPAWPLRLPRPLRLGDSFQLALEPFPQPPGFRDRPLAQQTEAF